MDDIFRKLSVIFVGILLMGYGYLKNKEQEKLEKECKKVVGKVVDYEEDEEGYGRYIYEYEVEGVKYRAGFNRVAQKGKKEKVERKFGDNILLYYNKENPKNIFKVSESIVLLSFLGGIFVIILAIFFV